jgi:hypothetical protein
VDAGQPADDQVQADHAAGLTGFFDFGFDLLDQGLNDRHLVHGDSVAPSKNG